METKSSTEGLTTEHIKSHLQKYRINYERSRLEVQRLNEKHTKRSLKRYHRHTLRRGAGAARGAQGAVDQSIAGTSDDQWTSAGVHVPNTTLPQDSDQQWNMCDALLLEDAEQQMHLTMQQRMDFHRELLLTRSVEVASGLSWANRMNRMDRAGVDISRVVTDDSNTYDENQTAGDSSFLQAWANAEQLRQQEEQVYGRLHQQQQSLFLLQQQQQQQPSSLGQDATPVAHFSMGTGSQPEPPSRTTDGSMATDGGIDLSGWDRLSLTVDPDDDDDVFGFLRP